MNHAPERKPLKQRGKVPIILPMSGKPEETLQIRRAAAASVAGLPSRYQDRGVIAQGGMGVVIRAFDQQLGRDVAIKVLLVEGANDSQNQERFLREAKTLAALDQANIVKMLTWGVSEGGSLYLVMEFLDGLPLASEIGNGRYLTEKRFFDVFSQALAGLAYAHAQGVIHRDCTPGNIILLQEAESLRVKLVDFSIAINENAGGQKLTQTGALLGSPAYMSPEQCKGAPTDQRSDIYSMGCVMYEAFTGNPPHKGESVMDIMYRHVNCAADSLEKQAKSETAKQLGKLIDGCLCREPESRPQRADDVLSELNRIFASQSDTGSKLSGKVLVTGKTKNACLASALVALVLIAAGACFTCLQNQNRRASEREAAKLAGKPHEDVVVQQIEKQVQAWKRAYEMARSDSDRRDCATRLVDHLMKLAAAQRDAHEIALAEKTLEKAMSYSAAACPLSDQSKATVMRDIALCKIAQQDYSSAAKILDQALHSNFRSGETRSNLLFEVANVCALRHDFAGSLKAYEQAAPLARMMDVSNEARDRSHANLAHLPYRSHTLERSSELFEVVRNLEKKLAEDELLPALRLLNRLSAFCLDEDLDTAKEILDQASVVIEKLPAKSPEVRADVAETSVLKTRLQDLQKQKRR